MPRITKRALFAAHINLSSHAASLAGLGSFLGFKFKEDLMLYKHMLEVFDMRIDYFNINSSAIKTRDRTTNL